MSEIREANSIVPYPTTEILSGEGELETYLSALIAGSRELFHHEKLPTQINSVAVDRYATWLSQLTAEDPLRRERAAFLHADISKRRLILPNNPSIGTSKTSTGIISRNPTRFFPLIRTHSHPDSTCFSPQDVKRTMAKAGITFTENDFVAEVLGAQGRNYLLLRTKESDFDDIHKVEETIDFINKTVADQHKQTRKISDDSIEIMGLPDELKKILWAYTILEERRIFGADYIRFFDTLALTRSVARAYKLGFYWSKQDGVFRLLNDIDLQNISDQYKEVLNRAFDKFIASLSQR